MNSVSLYAFLIILAMVGMISACQRKDPTTEFPAEMQQAWTQAFNAGDQDALLSTYTTDAVLLPPNASKVTGHAGVIEIFGEGLKVGLKATQTTETLEVRDDIAFRAGAYTLVDRAGAELDHGKYIELWRRQPDGSWKMSHDMWNSDRPPAAVPAPDAAAAEPAKR